MNDLDKRGSFVNIMSNKSKDFAKSQSSSVKSKDLNYFKNQITQNKLNFKK